jgi:hypothetical protein
MGCGCKNGGAPAQPQQTQQQTPQTAQPAQQNESVQNAVRQTIEKYYKK